MSKGAKPGQNRFAGSQKRHRDYRLDRIKTEIIPKLISSAGKISFEGATPFSRFCADLFNDGLPVNEKTIGYRTLVQSTEYWSLLEPIYIQHWDTSRSIEVKREKLVGKLAVQRADHLQAENERLKKENKALRSAIRNQGAPTTTLPAIQQTDQDAVIRLDKTCRALKLVLDASDGMFAFDINAKKISCTFDDLEPAEGLVPSSIIEPFVLWMKAKEKSHIDE